MTPTKKTNSSVPANEDSVQSNGSEVDRQLFNMMNESSLDFTSKFAKLAKEVTGGSSCDNAGGSSSNGTSSTTSSQ